MTRNCVKLVLEGDDVTSKKLASSFKNYINLKPILKDQFKVYHSLNTSYVKDHDDARLFVSETINQLKKYSFKDIKAYNALLETKFNPPKMKSSDVNYHIANLIKFATSDGSDVHSYVEALNKLTEHVTQIKETKPVLENVNDKLKNSSLKFLEPRHVVRIAIKKFNKTYIEKMDESDRHVFNILRSKDEKKINTLYEDQLSEIKQYANSFPDLELKEKIDESISIISNECTSKNILNGYELLAELRSLNKGETNE